MRKCLFLIWFLICDRFYYRFSLFSYDLLFPLLFLIKYERKYILKTYIYCLFCLIIHSAYIWEREREIRIHYFLVSTQLYSVSLIVNNERFGWSYHEVCPGCALEVRRRHHGITQLAVEAMHNFKDFVSSKRRIPNKQIIVGFLDIIKAW